MMTNLMSDPWQGLSRNPDAAIYNCREVEKSINPQHKHLDWVVTERGNRGLLIGYDRVKKASLPIPRFQGILIQEDPQYPQLKIELLDNDMLDAFLKICLDLIQYLQRASDNKIRSACLKRLSQWANMFKMDPHCLGPNEQRGLLAELVFLEKIIPLFPDQQDILDTWVGPDSAPHDFVFGNTSVEVKSYGGASSPYITISSVQQLNVDPQEKLFLYALAINRSSGGHGITLTEQIGKIRSLLPEYSLQDFDFKLMRIGYSSKQDYDEWRWECGHARCFIVDSEFPHIDESHLPDAISKVQYRIDMDRCVDFETTQSRILSQLKEANA